MSLRQFITKEGRQERALERACAKASNHLIKPDDRKPALFFLAEQGSERAIEGLLGRFSFNYITNTVSDEEEKNFVFDQLRAKGESILPQLKTYLRSAPSLSWGLRLLDEVAPHETCWSVLCDVLNDYDPEYERDPSKKLQLLTFLGDFQDDRVTQALLPFLDDHDETVRFNVVDALFKQNHEAAREPLIARLLEEDEESLRIKNRIVEGFIEAEWPVRGYRGKVEKVLGSEFIVDGKGKIRRKKGRG